jgi:hypothetical protein
MIIIYLLLSLCSKEMYVHVTCVTVLLPASLFPLSLSPYWAQISGPLAANKRDRPPDKQIRGAFSRMQCFGAFR